MSKKSFIMYHDQSDVFSMMTDEQAGQMIKAIFRYSNGDDHGLSGLMIPLFATFKASMDRDANKWIETREKRSEAGRKSAEAKAKAKAEAEKKTREDEGANKRQQTPTKPTSVESVEQAPTKSTVNVNATVNVIDTVSDRYTKEFESFWSVYPKKKEKIRSQKSFNRAKKVASVESIMNGLMRSVKSSDWTKCGCKYVPKPANWLDGGGWDDEPLDDSQSNTTSSFRGF